MKERFLSYLRSADREQANALVSDGLARGLSKDELLNDVVIAGLDSLSRGWDEGTVSLTQLYMAGRISEEVASSLLTEIAQPAAPWCNILIATLSDRHGLGQRIVAGHLAVSGANVVSLGIGVSAEDIVRRASNGQKFDIIAISVLMYRSALLVETLRALLERERLPIPLLVGGAPFNLDRTLWQKVGAAAMGSNPAEGVATARQLVGAKP